MYSQQQRFTSGYSTRIPATAQPSAKNTQHMVVDESIRVYEILRAFVKQSRVRRGQIS